ncbi:hypothetical protein [Streptomyces sp. NPDC018031]|uniref:hypothetical protein n=1 Tax=Streptomyces sp. NPDC018031 TaxID=3365033 RepID=UPI003797C984
MTYDKLVCANCASPVSEGRCPVCRASRARMQQDGVFGGLTPAALLSLLVALIAVALVAHEVAVA